MSAKQKLLLVEDDKKLSTLITKFFARHGFEVTQVFDGREAESQVDAIKPDAIILDWMLPGIDGIGICSSIRHRFDGLILMLTARIEDIDQVVALECGADDYVAKPVNPRVLLARVMAGIRRNNLGRSSATARHKIEFGNVTIDSAARTLMVDGESKELTAAEFDMLWLLASKNGETVTRDQISLVLRGVEYDGVDRTFDLRVSKLRQCIGDDPRLPRVIKTVRGKGYLFNGSGLSKCD